MALVLVSLVAAWSSQGYCPMSRLVSGAGSEAHDCCKTGLTAAPPSCCHAAAAAGSWMTAKVRPLPVPLVASVPHGLLPPIATQRMEALIRLTPHLHSPPSEPLVLRI